jgi:uncharacterized protein (TIGR02444 family)
VHVFTRFALQLYRLTGVADACLHLQNRHDVDVNLVLFAAFVGVVRRQQLTVDDLDFAHRKVDAWHQEVVRPLRAVRQRLKTGPSPAPDDITGSLRRKLAQLEIEAEVIELNQLSELISDLNSTCSAKGDAESTAAAIELVISTQTGTTLDETDSEAIAAIAAAAQLLGASDNGAVYRVDNGSLAG